MLIRFFPQLCSLSLRNYPFLYYSITAFCFSLPSSSLSCWTFFFFCLMSRFRSWEGDLKFKWQSRLSFSFATYQIISSFHLRRSDLTKTLTSYSPCQHNIEWNCLDCWSSKLDAKTVLDAEVSSKRSHSRIVERSLIVTWNESKSSLTFVANGDNV